MKEKSYFFVVQLFDSSLLGGVLCSTYFVLFANLKMGTKLSIICILKSVDMRVKVFFSLKRSQGPKFVKIFLVFTKLYCTL